MVYDERKKALRLLIFLIEKRNGTTRARGCADGRSQHEYTTKADTSSPTVSLEAMMMSCAIDAREGRHLAVTNIPWAFLHAYMESDVHIAKLIVKLYPSLYRKYIWKSRSGKPMLYVNLRKAVYRHFRQPYCSGNCYQTPSHEMLGEGFTKRLQGVLFAWIQSKILNLPSSPNTGVC